MMNPQAKVSMRGSWGVYDGRKCISRVELRKGRFTAIDNRGYVVAKCDTLHEAMGAAFTTARRRNPAHKTAKREM
jgi:translation elongation factor P/translation initiation factor 5A